MPALLNAIELPSLGTPTYNTQSLLAISLISVTKKAAECHFEIQRDTWLVPFTGSGFHKIGGSGASLVRRGLRGLEIQAALESSYSADTMIIGPSLYLKIQVLRVACNF